MREEEPYSRAALWSRRLGLFAIPVAAISVIVMRSGDLDFGSSLAAVGAGLALAALALVLGIAALISIWVRGDRGAGAAAIGVLCGLLVLGPPIGFVVLNAGAPGISDITTDPSDPPAFVFAAGERRTGENGTAYAGERTALTQLSAYPDIQPLRLSVPPDDAHALALEIVRERGWQVLDAGSSGRPPRRRIEAVARTRIMGFRDDVVIRVRADGTGSRVDVRSASRIGNSDFGANARRIRAFLADLAAAAR